ncbi:MAG: hypothetical protein DDT19_02288 [Syntrophomonadaceae bacterium]|nr:hypothetical protein [Bacillota bacterium]
MRVNFTIPGPAVPKQRPRKGKYGNFYTPGRTQEFEETVAWLAKEAAKGCKLSGRLGILVVFYQKRKRADSDNCLKAIQDGIEKSGAIADDKQFFVTATNWILTEDDEKIEVSIWEEEK